MARIIFLGVHYRSWVSPACFGYDVIFAPRMTVGVNVTHAHDTDVSSMRTNTILQAPPMGAELKSCAIREQNDTKKRHGTAPIAESAGSLLGHASGRLRERPRSDVRVYTEISATRGTATGIYTSYFINLTSQLWLSREHRARTSTPSCTPFAFTRNPKIIEN